MLVCVTAVNKDGVWEKGRRSGESYRLCFLVAVVDGN